MKINSLEKVLQVTCPLHPSYQSDILHIVSDSASHRACINCLLRGNVSALAALDLKRLFQMGDDGNCILTNYPPLNDSRIYKRLESIQQYSVDQVIEQIKQFIINSKHSFDEILEKIQRDSIRSVEELGKQRKKVLDLYQSLCDPTKLKEVVMQASQDKQEGILHEIILKKCQDSVINESKLQSVITQFEENQQKFSIKLINKSTESLKNTMQNLSFFTSPITQMLHSHSILQEFSLVPSNLFDTASRIVIKKEYNQPDVFCIQDNGNICQLYSSNVLDNNTHYSFYFYFRQDAQEGPPQFNIGLINQNDKDKNIFNGCRYREESSDCSINKIIKGVALNSTSNDKEVYKEVEMRVHLASRTVKVADYPYFYNVVGLSDKTLIREGCQYCLLVEVGQLNNHNMLTDVVVSEGFDNKM